jgi:hypothetical protein
MEDNRITVSKMKSQLESLEKEGHGDKYVFVGEYYVGETFNSKDKTGLWNDVIYKSIHHSDIPMTKEQEDYVKKINKEYNENLPEKDKEFINKLKFKSPEEIKKQTEDYIKYLNTKKKEGKLDDDKYQEMINSIHD